MPKVTLHGQELQYIEVGSGPPVVLVHGLMSSSQTWAGQLGRLAVRHRVVAPDLFGHGASDKPLGDYSLGSHAASLRDLLDHLDIARATVVGHSFGGGTCLQFAYLFPERVDALVLVSSGGLGRELNPLLRAAALPGADLVLAGVASTWLHGLGTTALGWWARAGLPAVSRSSEEAWRSLSTLRDASTRRAFLATSRSVIDVRGQAVSAVNRLGGFPQRPTLLIWGDKDRIVPSSHVDAARRELPAARVEMLGRSGHFPHLDEPDRFAAVLEDFLAGLPSPAALIVPPD